MYITGYSLKAPNSTTVSNFIGNLYNNIDMVDKYLDLPKKAGHLLHIDKFDSKFFKFNKDQINGLDIQTRLLLETTYEALIDSGIKKIQIII